MDANYNILYVDDEDILLKVTKMYLEKTGDFFVDLASSASEGLKKILSQQYDAVVSDYEMPEINGIEFLSRLRSSGNDIPFIIFTGRGREEVVIDALNNGVDFYLQKGGQPKAQFAELKSKIRQAVRRKRAEYEIEAGKKQLLALINAAGSGEMLISSEGEILALNRIMAKRFGKEPKNLLGFNAFENLPPGLLNIEKIILEQKNRGSEQFSYRESGEGRHYRNNINPVTDRYGNIVSYAVFSNDLTDQLNAEDSLASAKEHLDVTLKSIGDGVIVTDEKCNIQSLNRIAENLTGWSEEDAIGKSVDEVFRLTDLSNNEKFINPARMAIESGEIVNISDSVRLESRNGKEYVVGDSAAPIKDRNSQIKGSVIVFRDITLESEARDYKYQLASIIESSDDAIIGTDTDGVILSWNNGAEVIFGYTEDEVLGKKVDLVYTDASENELNSVLSCVRNGGKISHHNAKRKRKDGKIIDVSLTVSPIVSENNEIIGLSGISRDITDIAESRRKLRESYEWSSTVLRSIGDAIITTDNKCNITYLNPVAESLTGWNINEALNKPLTDVFKITNEYTGKVVENPLEKVLKEGRVFGLANHTILTGRYGNHSPIDDSGAPIMDANGDIAGGVIVFRDISARKKAEKLLSDSESKYRALFNSTGAATVIIDENGTIILSNAGFEKLSGYSCNEIDGRMKWMDFVEEEFREIMVKRSYDRDPVHSPYHDSYEFRFNDRFGNLHDILLILESIKGSNNAVCNLIDISEQKNIQKNLIASENKLNTILDSLPHIIVQKDRDLRILWANAAAKKLNPDLLGRTCYEAFLGQNELCRECNALNAMESGEIRKKTIFHENVSGRGDSYWEKTSIPIMDYRGEYSSVVELTKDVTMGMQLKGKVSLQHNLAENLSITSSLDDALNIIFESLLKIPGFDSGILFLRDSIKCGLSLVRSDGITDEYKESVSYLEPDSMCVKRLGEKKPIYGSVEDISPDMVDISNYEGIKSFAYLPIISNEEIIGAFFLISHVNNNVLDLSKETIESTNDLIGNSLLRIVTEEELRKSREILNIALKSAELSVWEYYAEDGKIKWFNNLMNRLGYSCDDIIDFDQWLSIIHPDDQEIRNRNLNRILSGSEEFYSCEYRILSFNGNWRWVSVLGKATTRNSDGKVTHIAGVIQDITEIKDNEDALKVANKKLNLLSSITRHDIMNQITPALAYLDMSREISGENETLLDYLKNVERSVNVISSQISFTKDYQDLGVELPLWQNLFSVVDKAGAEACLSGIEPDLSGICKDIEVFADPMFNKIFFNLFDNSVRHGEKISEISVSCKEDEGEIRIIYRDNGVGIPLDMKTKIFSKGIGKNTGLGLFLTKEIIDITGISIEENGIPGRCARFEIIVPRGKWRHLGD